MGDRSGSSRLQALFETALRDYKQETGITLAEHPLAKQLENCYSADSIITVLQTQAQAFVESRGGHRIPTSIKITVSFLDGLSAAVDAVGLVRQRSLTAALDIPDICCEGFFARKSNTRRPFCPPRGMCFS